MKKKLLLIDPIYNPGTIPPSVSLGKIESFFLQTDIEMSLSDFVVPEERLLSLEEFFREETRFIESSKNLAATADVVYISAEHGNELKPYPIFPRIKRLAAAVRAVNPAAKIVVGGALINLLVDVYKFDSKSIKEDLIDVLVLGQSLRALRPIAEALGLATIPNLADNYTHWNMWDFDKYPPYISVQLRSGCAYKCNFCFEGKIYDKNNLSESVAGVQATINHAKRTHGIRRFLLEDSVVMSYPDFDDIVDALGDTGNTYATYARITEIDRWPDKLAKLRKSGSDCAIVGIETLDDSILDSVKKKTEAIQTRRALAIAKSLGMGIQGCFMLGFLEGGLSDASRTIDFAKEQNLNCYRWHVYMPHYPSIDASFFSKRPVVARDVLDIQIDVPDKFLVESLLSGPSIGFLDQHALVRALPFAAQAYNVLSEIGYAGNYTYRDLVALMSNKILPIELPLNEDLMYPRLFDDVESPKSSKLGEKEINDPQLSNDTFAS